MRFRFTLRTMFLAVFAVASLLAFFTPVASINSVTCARIKPGMTEEQACDIVGVPPGWYDGVGGISSGAPAYKGYNPSWVGWRGEILVDLDETGRVSQATFYSAQTISWSTAEFFWERFTRVKYMDLPLTTRVLLFIVLTAIATLILGTGLIRSGAKNTAASYGVIGLVLGGILAAAMFSEDFVTSLLATALALLGPVFGALTGIVVALVLRWLPPRPERNPETLVGSAASGAR